MGLRVWHYVTLDKIIPGVMCECIFIILSDERLGLFKPSPDGSLANCFLR